MNVLLIIIALISSYVIGGFNSAYYIGKLWGIDDIRKYGSGNPGTTNVLRILGKTAALLTLLFDVAKGVVAVLLGLLLFKSSGVAILCGIAVILGHNYPIQLGFKGGKGIATSIGVIFLLSPVAAIYSLLIGIIVIIITKYVSLGSIVGSILFPIFVAIFHGSWQYVLFGVVMALMAVYRHRANIGRLISGTESKIKLY
ncbi:glycerol-3-phosphate acyltransferase PlsY [Caldanaerobius fijiensis DSM 17918]|uniref:Glycerol-3-phosphate acyltransferase n=1 Tax=Caldanaerobius fijiensis DSM 17918 TaxID=1121256 RepID=A0A1M4SZL7_9THEO|nr:glycerol-3-phosphate 1-O-acyltransferase PlsY [Caldanaerobius fijiensis]SHE37635.1 glycerol-3-phosphate acyltransferase PlsY [Caldanaerobius fijiensis DSM 17918]